MKISLKNIGPIKDFSFNLDKDLSIIFGENNIGKSYAITAIYLIIKTFGRLSVDRPGFGLEMVLYIKDIKLPENIEISGGLRNLIDLVNNAESLAIDSLISIKKSEINFTQEYSKILKDLITDTYLGELKKAFDNSFESLDLLANKFSNEGLEIKLEFSDLVFTIAYIQKEFVIKDLKMGKDIFIRKVRTNRAPVVADERITVYFNQRKKNLEIDIMKGLIPYINTLSYEVSQQVRKMYFLPASRSGLYQALSTFSAVIAELSKKRTFLSKKIELPNISEPVSDYFLYLSGINTKLSTNKYKKVIDNIESNILKGKVSFNNESKKIVFTPDGVEIELDLSHTSSMVAEIAPIVAFLKYIIATKKNPNEDLFDRRGRANTAPAYVIFVEEPEAHLHPKVQVELMELFVQLIKMDVKLVLTTHSNYMFNKLSNLILAKEIDHNKIESFLLKYVEGEGSVIDDDIMKVTEDGIIDSNFADVAEMLYNERIDIYEKLNESSPDAN